MLKRVNGIVIKTQDYGETHKIVTIFSQQLGKISGIARGANKTKSRMAAVTQPFIHGNFLMYISTGLSTIQQGEVSHSFRKVREDIIKTAYAAYIAELVDKLLESREIDLYIFEQFYQTMKWIETEEEYDIPVMMLEMKLYAKGGFVPIIDRCARCGTTQSISSFSIQEGGILCSNCFTIDQNAIVLPKALPRILKIFANVGLERVGNISIKQENKVLLRNLLDAYYDKYGGYFLKSKRFLKQIDLFK